MTSAKTETDIPTITSMIRDNDDHFYIENNTNKVDNNHQAMNFDQNNKKKLNKTKDEENINKKSFKDIFDSEIKEDISLPNSQKIPFTNASTAFSFSELEEKLPKKQGLSQFSHPFFTNFEMRKVLNLKEFPIDGNPLKSLSVEVKCNLLKINNVKDEEYIKNEVNYNIGIVDDKNIITNYKGGNEINNCTNKNNHDTNDNKEKKFNDPFEIANQDKKNKRSFINLFEEDRVQLSNNNNKKSTNKESLINNKDIKAVSNNLTNEKINKINTIIKQAFKKSIDTLTNNLESLQTGFYTYTKIADNRIEHNLNPFNTKPDNNRSSFNKISPFEIRNKDYLLQINNEEDSVDALNHINYYQSLTSLFTNFIKGKVRSFYIVSMFMTCYFTHLDESDNRKRLYIGDYYKSLEAIMKDSNIEYDKISNIELINKIRAHEAQTQKSISLESLETYTEEDLMRYFANTKEFIDDNMTSLICLKGVNMRLFFNQFINSTVNKSFIIYSKSPFINSIYNESIKITNSNYKEESFKLKLYGCFFPSDITIIKDIIVKAFKLFNNEIEDKAEEVGNALKDLKVISSSLEFEYLEKVKKFFILNKSITGPIKKMYLTDTDNFTVLLQNIN